jgi:hypothetical protein
MCDASMPRPSSFCIVRTVTQLIVLVAAVVLAIAVVAAGAGAATATKTKTTVVTDHSGDIAEGGVDLVRATFGRTSGGLLRASISSADDFAPGDLLSRTGPPGSICIELWTVSTAGSNPPDFLVCVTANATGDALRATIMKQRPNQLPQLVGPATVTRSSGHNVTLRFGQTAVGKPATIAFAVEASKRGCTGHVTCIDSAPNAPAVATLKLRTPASATG